MDVKQHFNKFTEGKKTAIPNEILKCWRRFSVAVTYTLYGIVSRLFLSFSFDQLRLVALAHRLISWRAKLTGGKLF